MKKEDQLSSFTADPAPQELETMPSITRLLNRKKLLSTKPSSDDTLTPEIPDSPPLPPPAPQVRAETFHSQLQSSEISLRLDPFIDSVVPGSSSPTTPPRLKVQPAARRKEQSGQPKLEIWAPETVTKKNDLIGKALAALIKQGAQTFLILNPISTPASSPAPHFASVAAINPGPFQALWNGLRWDPTYTPEVWAELNKNRFAELPAMEPVTSGKHPKQLMRATLGVQPHQWLTLLAIGPAPHLFGVITVLSSHSLSSNIQSVLNELKQGTKAA